MKPTLSALLLIFSLFVGTKVVASEIEINDQMLGYSRNSFFYQEKAPIILQRLSHNHLAVKDANGVIQQISDYAPLFQKACLSMDLDQSLTWQEELDSTSATFYCRESDGINATESTFLVTLDNQQRIANFKYIAVSTEEQFSESKQTEKVENVAKKTIAIALASLVAEKAAVILWPTEHDKVLHSVGSAWIAAATVILDKQYRGVSDKTAIRDGIIVAFLANLLKKVVDSKTNPYYSSSEAMRDVLSGTLGGVIGAVGIEYNFVF